MLRCPSAQRSSRDPADQQAQRRPGDIGESKVINEGGADCQRQEELDRIDRADHLARIGALDQQVRGYDRPPAAAARRIKKAADQAKRRNQTGLAQLRRIEQAAC